MGEEPPQIDNPHYGDNSQLVHVDREELFNRILSSYKHAYDKRLIHRDMPESDISHLCKVVSNNLKGYQGTLERNVDLLHGPLPRQGVFSPETHGFMAPAAGNEYRFVDRLVYLGDSCVYGLGMEGNRQFRHLDLGKVGREAYGWASILFRQMLDDRALKLFLENGGYDPEDEAAFFDKLPAYFDDYVRVLEQFSDSFNIISQVPPDTPRLESLPERQETDTTFTTAPPPPKKTPQKNKKRNTQESKGEEKPIEPIPPDDDVKFVSDKQREIALYLADFEEVRQRAKSRIIGQDEAIDAVIDGIILESVGAKDKNKPWNFLAIGPTGVGKNHTFEVISEEMSALTGLELFYRTVNCSNFQNEGSANQLVGAPRGYIGHRENGVLTSFFDEGRYAPLRLLLFDEFEKSQQSVMDLLLPALDKGGLYDNKENYIDLSGTWIAFTSNLGYSDIRGNSHAPVGFTSDRERVRQEKQREWVEGSVSQYLSPEFTNRVNIVHFNYLDESHMQQIFDIEFSGLTQGIRQQYGLDVVCTEDAKQAIIKEGTSPDYGARFLKSTLEQRISVPLSRRIHGDMQVDRPWSREMIEYLEQRKNDESLDREAILASIKDYGGAKLPYERLYVDMDDGEIIIRR